MILMTRSSHHFLTAALALVLATAPAAASAQGVVQALPGTTDADKLGDVMRQLATNPRDIDALIKAGDLSMGLGDLSGAAALFARAEKVNPRDGRAKAGMASILVRSERPGEALRYYAQAEGLGLDPRKFAADRGLAYDLIGQQDRAQRDYRVALRDAPDDETIRRYALSLGISGKPELAIQQLNPLLLKSDRGAWRSRAFIIAMNGDVAGAEKIATTMMPAGTAQGLQPFFQRLPSLPASDRAFAVHFGEVHATPTRLADARMTPPLGMLAPDPTAPVMVAAAPRAVVVATSGKTKRNRRGKPDRTEMAAVTTRAAATTPVAATPATTIPAAIAPPVQLASSSVRTVQATPMQAGERIATQQPTYRAPQVAQAATGGPQTASPVSVARAALTPTGALPATTVTQMAAVPAGRIQSESNTRVANAVAAAATRTPAQPATTSPVQPAPVQQASVQSQPVQAVPMRPAPMQPAPVQLAAAQPTSVQPLPVRQASAAPLPSPGFSAGATPSTPPVEVAAAIPPRAVASSEDSILARIVAGLSIPASELGVAPMHPAPVVTQAAVPMPDDAERVLAEAKAKTERDAAAKKIAAEQLAADKKAALDKKAAARKVIADKKALAEKKAAAAEKLAADKAAAEEKRIARANPERVWVQVSTGATEGDLPKAWKKAKAKAPTVFGTRGGWTAPWKATNRVLAGPFKTDAEARTFVNQLAKEGVSTFTFTSDPGEIITKLPSK